MKKIIFIFLIGVLFSCKDALVEEPKSIAAESFYNTESEIETAIAAGYDKIRPDMYSVSLLECNADYQTGRGSWALISDYQGFNSTNISRSEGRWSESYLAIRNANIVIMKAPDGTELTDAEKTSAVAEAKFIRAFAYFDLVRNYAGVPIRTEDNYDAYDVARASEEDVWALIISDLKEAESGLPDDAPVPGRASKWAAKTVLADVYFYQGMNSEAAAKSEEVIASNKYSLVPVETVDDYTTNLFSPDLASSSEEIFYKKFSHEHGSAYAMMCNHPGTGLCGGGGWYGIYSDFGSNNFMKSWTDTGDLRKQLWYNWDIGVGSTSYLTLKVIDPDSPGTMCANDLPLYRYADVLLLNAEAECRATGTVSATDMERLNMVHRRAFGYDALTVSPVDYKIADYDKDSFCELVVLERGKEQQCEGKRWYDLKRLGFDKLKEIVFASRGIVVAEKHLLYPIPVTEIENNDSIDATDQNPGY